MDGTMMAATLEVATARAALLRLLPELALGAPAGRSTAQRLLRLLAPPDWLAGRTRVSAELVAFVRVSDPIIAAGSWQVIENTGSGEFLRSEEAALWNAARERAWALEAALSHLSVLREAQRVLAAD